MAGCLLAALAACALVLAWLGKPGLRGVWLLVDGGFLHGYALADTLRKAVPIFLCSLGVAVCFRMRLWNIGAEGQFALGTIGATFVALEAARWPGCPAWLLVPAMFLGAMAGGGLWALGPAWLRTRFQANEIITTLMANYIAVLLLQFLVYGPWKDPVSHGFPMTALLAEAARVGNIPGTRVHYGVFLCLGTALALRWWLTRTRLGFELLAAGENPQAARLARMPLTLLTFLAMGLCGALAGLAGGLEIMANVHRLQPQVMAGYGFTAVVAAWLGRLRLPAMAGYAILLAGFRVGVENLQLELQIPAAVAGVLEGALLLAVLAGQCFETRRLALRRNALGKEGHA